MPGFQQFTMGAPMTPQSKPIAQFLSKLMGWRFQQFSQVDRNRRFQAPGLPKCVTCK
jgi:hypothetical protein